MKNCFVGVFPSIEKKIKELNGGSNSSNSSCLIGGGIPSSNGEGQITNHHQHHTATAKFSIAGPITDL